jgi:glycosyltransferase involved in cell wall biosynthesis
MHDVLTAYGVKTPMTVLPTPVAIPENPGDGASFRARHGIPTDRPVLVHVGRIAHEKNIGFLLEVTAKLRESIPEVLLIVAGEGPAVPSLRRRAKQLGIGQNTRFVGYQDRSKDLWDCFAAGDVFVFSSRTETQGLVLLEAMALGIPVVSTAELGTRDVLQPDSGARVVPEEVEAFAAAVAGLLANPEVRRQLGRLARDYVERRWAVAPTTERLTGLYRSTLDRVDARSRSTPRLADATEPTGV